jgi:hypothetical protein
MLEINYCFIGLSHNYFLCTKKDQDKNLISYHIPSSRIGCKLLENEEKSRVGRRVAE